MEVHRQYDLRSKKNQDKSRKRNSDTVVKKAPETILKRTANSNNFMAKKTDQNKDKTSQTNIDPSYPSTSTRIPEKTFLNKAPNQNQQIKNIEKFMADKTETNMP